MEWIIHSIFVERVNKFIKNVQHKLFAFINRAGYKTPNKPFLFYSHFPRSEQQ